MRALQLSKDIRAVSNPGYIRIAGLETWLLNTEQTIYLVGHSSKICQGWTRSIIIIIVIIITTIIIIKILYFYIYYIYKIYI